MRRCMCHSQHALSNAQRLAHCDRAASEKWRPIGLRRADQARMSPPGQIASNACAAFIISGPKWSKSGQRGDRVKRHTRSRTIERNLAGPNAVSPANTDSKTVALPIARVSCDPATLGRSGAELPAVAACAIRRDAVRLRTGLRVYPESRRHGPTVDLVAMGPRPDLCTAEKSVKSDPQIPGNPVYWTSEGGAP